MAVKANPNAFLKRDNLAKQVISVWAEMVNNRSELQYSDMKWSDVLKASELMAKYAGMFKEGEGDTFNTIVVNAKETNEMDLLKRLKEIQQESKSLADNQAIYAHSNLKNSLEVF